MVCLYSVVWILFEFVVAFGCCFCLLFSLFYVGVCFAEVGFGW